MRRSGAPVEYMNAETISIQVSPEVAKAYRAASEKDRRKLDLFVTLQLTEFLGSSESLEEVMGDMSREAAATGLTPEFLDSVLRGR